MTRASTDRTRPKGSETQLEAREVGVQWTRTERTGGARHGTACVPLRLVGLEPLIRSALPLPKASEGDQALEEGRDRHGYCLIVPCVTAPTPPEPQRRLV